MFSVIGELIEESFKRVIFHAVVGNEVTSSNDELLFLCFRYVDSNKDIRESFLEFAYIERILGFGVSKAILNIIGISSKWCKLNFGPLRGQVKSREETIFLLFILISWHNWQEATWATLLDNDLDLLLPFK